MIMTILTFLYHIPDSVIGWDIFPLRLSLELVSIEQRAVPGLSDSRKRTRIPHQKT